MQLVAAFMDVPQEMARKPCGGIDLRLVMIVNFEEPAECTGAFALGIDDPIAVIF